MALLFTTSRGVVFRQPDGPDNCPSVSKRVGGGVGRGGSEEQLSRASVGVQSYP